MVLELLSDATGIPEPVLRVLFSILLAYPIALFYHIALLRPINLKNAPAIRNFYIVSTGLALAYFFNGPDIIHSLITTTVTWLLMWFGNAIDNRKFATALIFIFNITYLTLGYYYTATDEYDIDWTMTQCVLCLRMIGFAMDFMDGVTLLKSKESPDEKTTSDNKPAATANPSSNIKHELTTPRRVPHKQPVSFEKDCRLATLPSFLETIGYAYFFGAFLIGPQFSFKLYRKFITFSIYPNPTSIPSGSYKFALKCFLLGAIYLGAHQIAAGFFPINYLITEEYSARPFWEKLAFMWFATKFSFTKYLGVWTLAEGACVLSGISFNGYNEKGQAEWDGLSNVSIYRFEFATSLSQIVAAFNTNTNLWSKLYIFKRLMFLGNKNLSSIITLFFLAVWHGTHAGYFLCFSLEFFDIEVERRWSKRLEPYTRPLYDVKNRDKPLIQLLRRLHLFACWFGQTCGLHYAMVPFTLLRWEYSLKAWGAVYYCGHIVFVLLFLDMILPKRREKKSTEHVNTVENVKLNGESKINGYAKINQNGAIKTE
ncbi:1049_t:CDS:2 [Ambispora leptoticha]|uniref:Lysophospholipid acyltransferase 5 n=1 Tax=Ambispora leptoticha TaxID=144679 RepID=A0A9N9B9K7_9GLOM|nr:1049_t:CDS:2 [Ambispora leptoticha]